MRLQIPNNYVTDLGEGGTRYKIPMPGGGGVSFFLNTDPLDYSDFDDLVLSTFDLEGNEITSDIKALSKVDLAGSTYRIYCEDIELVNEVEDGVYFMVIWDSSDNSVFQMLNVFEAIGVDRVIDHVRLDYRHSTNIFNFNYEELPDFYNSVFLDMNEIGRVGEYEKEVYQEQTTGDIRPRKNLYKEAVTIETYQFDYPFHSAMRALSMHDTILINNEPYQVKSGYEYAQSKSGKKSNGTIQFYDQAVNQINLNG